MLNALELFVFSNNDVLSHYYWSRTHLMLVSVCSVLLQSTEAFCASFPLLDSKHFNPSGENGSI